MNTHQINISLVKDWDSFHNLFASQFNFPDYYGRNMNAWIDCMEDYAINGFTVLEFGDCRVLKENNSDIHQAILECSAFINYRSTESGGKPKLLISMG